MQEIHTFNEIKLLRSNLRHELRYHENHVKMHSREIISAYQMFLTKTILDKGIHSILNYFFKEKKG